MDKDSENAPVQRSVPQICVCANQPIYYITQNVTTVNLAITSEFNYDLIMFKEILINKFHLFHEHFPLIHYLNAVKYNNNNNICLTAIGLWHGGSGFKHIYKYLTLCY